MENCVILCCVVLCLYLCLCYVALCCVTLRYVMLRYVMLHCVMWCYAMLCYLRDWSRSVGSYGNNTRVICCPAPGRPESAARGTSPPDNKSRGCCCRNSRPTVINPDYNMTKQRYITRIYDKKNVQNHHQIERRRLLASIVTSRISP